ncbi:MAG TPA: hypothetical protein VF385_03700 [Patescibacteria group bacterium]
MLIFYFFILVISFSIIFLFSSPKLSPIPYFPSQPVDIPKIIKVLNLKNDQIIFDLGAGDGIIIFGAAKSSFQNKLNTQFIAVEINPVLILILHLRRLFHPNRKNIKIVRDDIFRMNIKDQISNIKVTSQKSKIPNNETMKQFNNVTIYLYISPWYLEKTISNIKNQISKYSVVSYMYSIKSLKNKEKIIQGKNSIFVYDF